MNSSNIVFSFVGMLGCEILSANRNERRPRFTYPVTSLSIAKEPLNEAIARTIEDVQVEKQSLFSYKIGVENWISLRLK